MLIFFFFTATRVGHTHPKIHFRLVSLLNQTQMAAFVDFFELEIQERKNKIFKTKKRLEKLSLEGEILQDAENDGTAIQNSNDNVEDIIKRNIIESRDIPLEKVIFKLVFEFQNY